MLDVDVADTDLVGFHKVKPSASLSVYVVVAADVVAVGDVVVGVIHRLVGAYPVFEGPVGSDQVVVASRRQRQQQLEPFYLDPMAFVSSGEAQQRSVCLDQSERQLRVVDVAVVAGSTAVAGVVVVVAGAIVVRLETVR